MATEATEILSVADAKSRVLRVDGDDNDALVLTAIKAAVSDVSLRTGLPLIDRSKIFTVIPNGTKEPLLLNSLYVRQVTEVMYWGPNQALRERPAGVVATADLGRIDPIEYARFTEVWPPVDGWPQRLAGTDFRITATVGYDIPDEEGESLVQAVALLTRHFYESPDYLEAEFAINSLLARWIDYPS